MKKLTLMIGLVFVLALSSISSAAFVMYDDFTGPAGQCDGTKWTGEYWGDSTLRPYLDGSGAVRVITGGSLEAITKFALPQPADVGDVLTIEFAVKQDQVEDPIGPMRISPKLGEDRIDLYCGFSATSTMYSISSVGLFGYTSLTIPLPGLDVFDQIRFVFENVDNDLKFRLYKFNGTEWQLRMGEQTLYLEGDAGWAEDAQFTVSSGSGARSRFDYVQYEYIPEPATLSLLGVGGLVVLVRRKR